MGRAGDITEIQERWVEVLQGNAALRDATRLGHARNPVLFMYQERDTAQFRGKSARSGRVTTETDGTGRAVRSQHPADGRSSDDAAQASEDRPRRREKDQPPDARHRPPSRRP